MSDEQPIDIDFLAGQQELILSELAAIQDTLDMTTDNSLPGIARALEQQAAGASTAQALRQLTTEIARLRADIAVLIEIVGQRDKP